jgi:hypothetical protein
LVAPTDSAYSIDEFKRWGDLFIAGYPDAREISHREGRLTLTTGDDHAFASLYPLLHHYPTRFGDEKNPYLVKSLSGEMHGVFLFIPRDLVEEGNITPIASALQDMVSTREKATAFRQRVGVMVDGYDDSRELWQISNARQFCRRLFEECPFVFLLAHPDAGLLKLLAACWAYEDVEDDEHMQKRVAEFVTRAFKGLNDVAHRLALSEELNREVCEAAAKALLGG